MFSNSIISWDNGFALMMRRIPLPEASEQPGHTNTISAVILPDDFPRAYASMQHKAKIAPIKERIRTDI